MHELRLARDLVGKVDAAACEQGARRVVGVKVTLGALSGISGQMPLLVRVRDSEGHIMREVKHGGLSDAVDTGPWPGK